MLFNSFPFLLIFLPLCLAGFFYCGRRRGLTAAVTWLGVASLAFYAWWDWHFVALLLTSILLNSVAGQHIVARRRTGHVQAARRTLQITTSINLVALAYFKYANFFLDTWASTSGAPRLQLDVVLPIGISFFTFTQIAFLVDAWRGEVQSFTFRRYFLFVTYFPHLIAGPILHHREMMTQFANPRITVFHRRNMAVGVSILAIGLFKKVILADNVALFAAPLFTAAGQGAPISFFDAWGGTLAYTFQLYFDFSAYSDMAIGISTMFGIRIPVNFNSPYKSTNIVEFWRRWHMSLSRFLRDYLYIPLGGSRCAPWRRHANLFVTMLLGGLWHGAGWTFVLWGALHGSYLVINHAWRRLFPASSEKSQMSSLLSGALTFLAVMVAWVFFRAESVDAALGVLKSMSGLNGLSLPSMVGAHLSASAREIAIGLGVSFEGSFWVRAGDWQIGVSWIALCGAIAFLMPNTYQLFSRFRPALPIYGEIPSRRLRALHWRPALPWAGATAIMVFAAVISLYRPSEFLYFQF